MVVDPTLLWPMLALVALTFLVTMEMYRRRIAEIRSRRIPLASIATSRGMATLEDVAAADNFRNLFEMPVLFYAACLTLAVLGPVGWLPATLAWCYVALRVLHSAIHLRSNRVRWRFNAFALSTAVLVALWMVAAAEIAGRGHR
jgi:hypothetical protein